MECAKEIYGPIITSLRGETVRYKPDQVNIDYIEFLMWVSKANYNVTLFMDIVFIGNMVPLFSTISSDMKFITV